MSHRVKFLSKIVLLNEFRVLYKYCYIFLYNYEKSSDAESFNITKYEEKLKIL